MKLKLKAYGALCELETFIINGITADYNDFGSKQDEDTENAEPYACGDMRFTSKPLEENRKTLEKYHITEEEYEVICEKLSEALSFGQCGWCV